ncbi:MAG: NHLP bacteriocin export ABC transporter permease/ATPase subunit [Butyrivibrio sp.]|nr:NHLP bacteriocin export ABC transporter permease/ATPase subunit [Butyrivibrio sp.]
MSHSTENAGKFHIAGGELFITEDSQKVYRVISGRVLVYLIAFEDSVSKKRLFLAEMGEDSILPGFNFRAEDNVEYRFGFVALSDAEFVEDKKVQVSEARDYFARVAELTIPKESSFDRTLIEFYNMSLIVDEGYIYRYREEAARTKERSLKLIENVLKGGRAQRGSENSFAGKPLYDCVTFLCGREKINIAPFESIKRSAGNGYDINDIARISHFNVRKITLENGWYKKDCGALIVSGKESGVFCAFPGAFGRYRIYDPVKDMVFSLDGRFAEGLDNSAVMLYRPFPDEVITPVKMILFGMEKVYRSDIVRLILMTLLGILVGLLLPYLNEQVYDNFITLGNRSGLLGAGLVILACSIGNIAFNVVKNLSAFRAMNTMEYAVQSAAIDRLFNLPESFFRKFDAADLGLRLMSICQMFNVLATSVSGSLLSALFSLFYIVRMAGYSGKLTLIAVIVIAIGFNVVIYIGSRQLKYEKQKLISDNSAAALMYQYISGIEKLRSTASCDRALLNYYVDFSRSRRINISKERLSLSADTFIQALEIFTSMIFYYMVAAGGLNISIGRFMGFTSAFSMLFMAILDMAKGLISANQVIPMFEMSKPILETLPENLQGAALPGDNSGEIELDNITFGYSSKEQPVINGLSLRIAPGEYVGIVGTSGSGKSTLLKLLMGFEKPQVGKIYYDGRDIDELDKIELRKKFGVVLQEGGLVTGNIFDNITLSTPGCSTKRVSEVIEQVGLKKDIDAMPMGLYTVVSESGNTISGGQAQRILIARAIAGRPKVMFFDEATSALDNVTQAQVMDTIEKAESTRIVIAHRLSTVLHCDRIIVLDNGKVAEEGNYRELMERKGIFYKLAIRQIA